MLPSLAAAVLGRQHVTLEKHRRAGFYYVFFLFFFPIRLQMDELYLYVYPCIGGLSNYVVQRQFPRHSVRATDTVTGKKNPPPSPCSPPPRPPPSGQPTGPSPTGLSRSWSARCWATSRDTWRRRVPCTEGPRIIVRQEDHNKCFLVSNCLVSTYLIPSRLKIKVSCVSSACEV